MIDLHSHVLPGIDDGARDLTEALTMARAYVADGVRCVVATPHIYPGVFDNTPQRIATAHAAFCEALKAEDIALEVQCAAEVRISFEVLDMLAQGQLCFVGHDGPWRHLLLELPDGQIPLGTDRLVDALLREHIKPIIAHPERNKAIMADANKLAPFIERGCYTQVTAASLLGEFGSKAHTSAVELLNKGWVHAIASDAHRPHVRPPRMKAARAWLTERYGADAAQRLTLSGPAYLAAQP